MLYNRGEQKLASGPDNTLRFSHGSVIRLQQNNTVFWSVMHFILAEAHNFYQTAGSYIPEDITTNDVISYKIIIIRIGHFCYIAIISLFNLY
jgi:hypothetical protein